MKPRTRLQRQVLALSIQLPNIESRMLQWAKVECLDHRGYFTKSRAICMDCGERFSPALIKRKRAVCPHCGTKLKMEQSRKTTDKQQSYFAIAEIHDDFQVIRNFELLSYYKSGNPARYCCYEILQHWVLPNEKREVVARNHTLNWYVDSWNGNMEIREKSNVTRFDIYPCKYHPDSEFKPQYKLYGIDHRLQGLTFVEAYKFVPHSPMAETLLKAKQYNLLSYAHEYGGGAVRFWPSMKICIRNGYIIRSARIWTDYLNLLEYFGKDLHNAHYVCPKNLKKEHDRYVKKKRAKQEREEAERKAKRAIENEKLFLKLKSRFFGICFSDDTIQVKSLDSVEEYKQEGDILHHCVFTNDYYTKMDSLILSARIGGKPIETIEVSLIEFNIIQSRGVRNENSDYHNRILKLVRKNMGLIKERAKALQAV